MNQVALLLALRYLRAKTPRSFGLYAIPLGIALLVGMLYGADTLARHSHDPRVLGFHA